MHISGQLSRPLTVLFMCHLAQRTVIPLLSLCPPPRLLVSQPLHPKDETPRHNLNSVVCIEYNVGKNVQTSILGAKQPFCKLMTQQRRGNTPGQDSSVYLHQGKGTLTLKHTFWTRKADDLKGE